MKNVKPMPWTDDELRHCVAAYLAMLAKEVAGEKYSKAEANRSLQQRINRSRGSIEMKWMNVSAVLAEAGRKYIAGYKPYPNYQAALKTAVLNEMRALSVYRDIDRNGESYTVYEGSHCIGTFLSDDPELAKHVKAIGGEKNIKGGIDNR